MIQNITFSEINLNKKDFTESELKLIDINGLSRKFMNIVFKNIDEDYYTVVQEIINTQYKIKMKYLKPVTGTYQYIAQKSQLITGQDIHDASLLIEPLNPDFQNLISYTPINQKIKIGTVVSLNCSIPFDANPDGSIHPRLFIWSNNLKLEINENDKVFEDTGYTVPWLMCCHFGAIETGSLIHCKFEVDYVNQNIYHSFTLFGFNRDDENKTLILYTFNCYNVSFIELIDLILEQNVSELTRKVLQEVLGFLNNKNEKTNTSKQHNRK